MRYLRAIAVVAVVLVALALISIFVLLSWAAGRAQREMESALGDVFQLPAQVQGLSFEFIPPKATLEKIEVGKGGSALLVREVRARLAPLSSVLQLRPVGEIRIGRVRVDLTKLPKRTDREEEDAADEDLTFPPFRARAVKIGAVEVAIPYGDHPLQITAARVTGQVKAHRLRGTLSFAGTVENLGVQRGRESTRLDRVEIRGGQTREGWAIDSLTASGAEVELNGGRLQGTQLLHHRLSASLETRPLRIFLNELAMMEGRVDVEGSFFGSLANPDFEAVLDTRSLTLWGQELREGRARVERKGDRFEVKSFETSVYGGSARGKGSMELSGTLRFSSEVEWSGIEVETLLERARAALNIPMKSDAAVKLDGTFDPLTLRGKGEGRFAPPASVAPLEWQGSLELDERVLAVDFRATQIDAAQIATVMRVDSEKKLDGTVELQVTDSAAVRRAFRIPAEPEVSGTLDLSGTLSGTSQHPVLSGQLSAVKFGASDVTVDRITSLFTLSPNQLRLTEAHADIGKGTVDASGTFALDRAGENDWEVRVAELSVSRFRRIVKLATGIQLPLWKGKMDAQLTGRSPWTALQVRGHVTATRFRIHTEPFQTAMLEIGGSGADWTLRGSLIHSADEKLTVEGRGRGSADGEVLFEASGWQLGNLRGASNRGLMGLASLRGRLSGNLEAPDGSVELRAEALQWRGRNLGALALTANGTAGAWSVQASALEDRMSAEGKLWVPGWTADLRLVWNQADLAAIVGAGGNITLVSTGRLQLRGPLADPAQWQASLTADSIAIDEGTNRLETTAPITLTLRDGRTAIPPLVLEGKKGRLQLSGSITTAGEITLDMRGSGSVELAELASAQIRSARGTFEVDAAIRRAAGQTPLFRGLLNLANVSLDVGLPVVLTDTYGSIELSGTEIRLLGLHGSAGGGTFALEGVLDIESGPALHWRVKEMSTGAVDWLDHEISGEGILSGPWSSPLISGKVEVLRALYDEPVKLIDFIPWFRKRVRRERGEAEGPPVQLDLQVSGPDELFVDNDFAEMELRCDIHVSGTTVEPLLSGPIEVLNGRVRFRDQIFDVTNAIVEFRPELGFEAVLNINAESTIQTRDAAYTVNVQVLGTTEEYQVILTSDDPALSQTDLVSLITFGKTVAQLQQGGAGFSTNDLIAIGAGAYARDMERSAKRVLPIDRVEIQSTVSRTTGQYEPRISIGKDITEDLAATISNTFGVEARQGVSIEYRLTPRISLVGTWESETARESGAFGGELRFRREYHRLPRFCLWCGDLWCGDQRPESDGSDAQD